MTKHDVILPLPSGLVAALYDLAQEREEAFEDLIRGMLDREVMRMRTARASVLAGSRRVSRLKHLLAPDMMRAVGWADLQARLALYGVELRPGGGDVRLHDLITGDRLCSGEALGFGYPELIRRFGGPLPTELSAATAA